MTPQAWLYSSLVDADTGITDEGPVVAVTLAAAHAAYAVAHHRHVGWSREGEGLGVGSPGGTAAADEHTNMMLGCMFCG